MDLHTKQSIESVTTGVSVVAVFYLIFGVWIAGLVDSWHKEELLKYETCYEEYKYYTNVDKHLLTTSYCGSQSE